MPCRCSPPIDLADILESASRDPRYTILLPLLFTVPEELPAPGVADILDRMFAAEAKYPASLQHRKFNLSHHCSH